MIIGLHLPSLTKEDIAVHIKGLTSLMPGKIKIYDPLNLDDLTKTIKAYDPRSKDSHLILLRTHYDFSEGMSKAQWRIYEYFFDLIGGTIWGDAPPNSLESVTYRAPLVDYTVPVADAHWGSSRSVLVRGKTKKYLGRASTDPHTILVGYSIEFASSSKPFDYLVSSLPNEWWQGVGFIRAISRIPTKFYEHFDDVNYVSIGASAHEFLDGLGVHHGQFPALPVTEYRDKTENHKMGNALRNIAREERDGSDWTF